MKSESQKKQGTLMKIRLYIMSLWLLFVLLFLLTIDTTLVSESGQFIGIIPLLKNNWIAVSSLLLAVIGFVLAWMTSYEWKGVSNPPYEIKAIKNENYEYLTFLTTYIIPLICMNLSQTRYILVLVILLVLVGFIFVRMDLYYGNPTLALMGYRLYRAEISCFDAPDGVILVSKDKLIKGSSIKWIPIDEFTWVAKEIKK